MLRKIILMIFFMAVLFWGVSCTPYEREGYNPKPFNAPAGWELQPYRTNQLRN